MFQLSRDYNSLILPNSVRPHAGSPIGIITVETGFAKLVGDVANAASYPFPVMYDLMPCTIGNDAMFNGDPQLCQAAVESARRLESRGAAAIVGSCGYLMQVQEQVAESVDVPVCLSSLLQLPLIAASISSRSSILILGAETDGLARIVSSSFPHLMDRLRFESMECYECFAPLLENRGAFDANQLALDICVCVSKALDKAGSIGAILLESSCFTPYSAEIYGQFGIPVFDSMTLVKWVRQSICPIVW